MTHNRPVFALLISIGLIGSATLFRILGTRGEAAGLYVAEKSGENTSQAYENVPLPIAVSSATSTSDSGPITETDLIGRQLLVDFIDLSANGQATDVNIQALADKHVGVIENLTSSKRVGLIDLKLVADTKFNFENYDAATNVIYSTYQQKIYATYNSFKAGAGINAETLKMARAAAAIYLDTANKFQNISVPYAVSQKHLELVNLLYANSASMEAVANADKDSTVAFSGLLAIGNGAEAEGSIVKDIVDILKKNGL